jgi:SAM-dependent methyltransferase
MLNANAYIYEEPDAWNGTLLKSPFERQRLEILAGLIPKDALKIVDIGCGDGSLASLLPRSKLIFGVDYSSSGLLKATHIQGVRGDAGRLGFRDQCCDLAICTEVMEHLDDSTFLKCVKELDRISRKYLLFTVLYKEQLLNHYSKCNKCRFIFHAWGHLRAFGKREDILQLFPSWELIVEAGVGFQLRFKPSIMVWIRKYIMGRWSWDRSTVCPRCGSLEGRRENLRVKSIKCGFWKELNGGV